MILKNASVMDADFKLRKKCIRIENERIVEMGENLSGDQEIDFSGRFILPGFIDTHIHGGIGVLLKEENPDLSIFTEYQAKKGVTSLALALSSVEINDLTSQMKKISLAAKTARGAKISAIHAEGPFLNKSKKGGMDERYIIDPDTEKLDRMILASDGLLKIITVAPDGANALPFITYAREKGIAVSMGHTDATYELTCKAIKAGATRLTHTFNAMRSYNHREPGILGACLTNPDIMCEVICDYVHLHPETVKLIYRLKGADNITMISDATAVECIPFSTATADGKRKEIKNGVVLLEDGTISGSAKTLHDGVKNLLESNYPIEDVSKMASYNPAKSIKRDDETGSLAPGKLADIVVLDKDYNVECTFVNGKLNS